MKQDRLSMTAGFMPAVIMALLLLLERLLETDILPREFWVIICAEVVAYLIPLAVLRLLPDGEGKKARFRFKSYRRQSVWFVLWISLMTAMLAAFLNGGFSMLLNESGDLLGSFAKRYEVTTLWQTVLVVVVLPAIVEELFFRGVMFSALERCGTWPALLLTSVSFAMIHGDLHNFVGPFAAGMIYGYMTYVLDSVWPAMFAHLVNNALMLFLYNMAETYSTLGIWPHILLAAAFVFCMFLSLSMRTLETQIEKGRVKRLQARSAGETLTGILVSPGMWLLLLLFIVRVLY